MAQRVLCAPAVIRPISQNAQRTMSIEEDTYRARLAAREAVVAAIRGLERRLSAFRLLSIAVMIGLAAFQLWWWALAAALVFIVLVVVHDRAVQRRQTAEAAVRFYARGVDRLTGSWPGKGPTGDRYRGEHHLYANDLDLFGEGSVYQLISTATTRAGQDLLAEWLSVPAAEPAEITSRQSAVRELRDRLDLREEMFVVGGEVTAAVEAGRLDDWAGAAEVPIETWERVAAIVLPAITTAILLFTAPPLIMQLISATNPETGIAASHFPVWPFLIAAGAQMLLVRRLASRIEPIVGGVERAEESLRQLTRLVRLIEREEFTSERLIRLRQKLTRGAGGTSAAIERLRRLVSLLDSRRNQFFAPFAILLLWTTNLGIAIERWRRTHRHDVLAALRAVAEFEALGSFASFAWENPSYAMPEVVGARPLFEATAVGHPLIAGHRRVCNDVQLGGATHLLLVSGSNMSGKSTMLRSVGLAAVLAQAGAPVCAATLRISTLAVGASITINDSIQEGSSRFYAEILRIRDVINLTSGATPVLFLLDEVLHGTNSHDRRIGAEGIVRKLVNAGAIGLVSTHDLALAELAESMAPAAKNVHFEDRIEDGTVIFDYRMRPGVVTHSNALELMRAVGIEV